MSDFWDDVGGVVRNVAPVIASAVGTPLAGAAVSALLDAVWPGDTSKTPTDLATAITAGQLTPDQVAAVRKADQDFAAKMKELDINLDQLQVQQETVELADDASARQMQTATKSTTAPILAYFITLGFFGLIGSMLFYTPPAANQAILNVLVGTLGTAWVAVVSFYFGSSHGKQAQDQAMASIAAQPSYAPAPTTTIPAGSKPVQGLPWLKP